MSNMAKNMSIKLIINGTKVMISSPAAPAASSDRLISSRQNLNELLKSTDRLEMSRYVQLHLTMFTF